MPDVWEHGEGVLPSDIQKNRQKQYIRFPFDLTTARTGADNDRDFQAVTGTYVYLNSVSDTSAKLEIQIETQTADWLPLKLHKGYRIPFDKFWIRHDAQAGVTCELVVAVEGAKGGLSEIIDNRAELADLNLLEVGGTAQTAADWSSYLANLTTLGNMSIGLRGAVIRKSNSVTGVATAILHTVTTAKTLVLFDFWVAKRESTAAVYNISVRNGADVFQYDLFKCSDTDSSAHSNSQALTFPVRIDAGSDIYLESSVAGNIVHGGCGGFEL